MSTATANNKRKKAMAGTVRARVGRGVLELLEKVELPEGKEVSVTILDVPSSTDKEAFRRAAGGWKGTVDAEALIKNIYADRLISTRPEPRL
jgi:predicted DNA-binding antitoxin AbrB/MazE fold protein